MRLNEINKLSSAVRVALTMGAVATAGIATTAQAQNADAGDKKSQNLETIVVTGSNIRRVDMETANPVVTIDRAAIQQTGKMTVGDLMQNLPAAIGGSTNPTVNNGGGSGSTTIGLRGLGSQRTLILVDGRRVMNKDLNTFPINMIERIEVLSQGASSVYGSDAIGGVVNIITRQNYQGAEFSTNFGESDHDDGIQKGYRITVGQSGDKGSVVAGIDYNKYDQILAGNRNNNPDYPNKPVALGRWDAAHAISITGSPSTAPYGFVGGSGSSPYGDIAIPAAFKSLFPNCASGFMARNAGASGMNPATDYHCYLNSGPNSDKYNYAPPNLILTPQERTNAFVNGLYHLTDNVDAYISIYHNKTRSAFQIAAAPVGTSVNGLTMSSQSYYNPFGVEFSKAGYKLSSRYVFAGPRSASNGNTTDQVAAGFKGHFDLFGDRTWTWDVGMNFGHQSTNSLVLGLPNQTILNQGAGPSYLDASTGQVVCGTPGHPIAGCIPFNPLNTELPQSLKAIAAASSPGLKTAFALQRTVHADVSGSLFSLPAGDMQLALGVDRVQNYTNSHVDSSLITDPVSGTCTLGSQCASPLQGGYSIKEAYAELFIPVLKDLPFINSLNATVGTRYSKYSNFGSTNNWKVSLEYKPIEDLLLRGGVSLVFRAPTIADLFTGISSDAPKLASDPCEYGGTGTNPNASNAACKGVPTTGPFVNTNVKSGTEINGLATGSVAAGFPLGPESGKSFNWGFVYNPHFIEGLSMSVDVWRIYLNNNITGIGAQGVLNLCFQGHAEYCPLVSRIQGGPSAGQIDHIVEPTGNSGRLDTSGVDLQASYRLPETPIGQFTATLNTTYLRTYNQQTAPGQDNNVTYHNAGTMLYYGSDPQGVCGGINCYYPRWKAQFNVGWRLGNIDASWNVRYAHKFDMGSALESQGSTGAIPGLPGTVLHYGSRAYSDWQVGYNIEPINTRVDAGINNVFDRQPPMMYSNDTHNLNTDPTSFDVIGRYFWGRLTVKF